MGLHDLKDKTWMKESDYKTNQNTVKLQKILSLEFKLKAYIFQCLKPFKKIPLNTEINVNLLFFFMSVQLV